MKILKIFGIVVGIHVFALILIFANPGCSSTSKTSPSANETAPKTDAAPVVSSPAASNGFPAPAPTTAGSSAITFNPNAPASAAAPSGDSGPRMAPTRPSSAVAGVLVSEPVSDVTPATSYTVKAGDNLSTIAKKNNITVAQLSAANSLTSKTVLHPGQKLIIPSKSMSTAPAAASVAASPTSSKTADTAAPTTAARSSGDVVKHVVKSGETLSTIAKKYDVRSGEIAAANNISDPAKIRPGMELIIPGWHAPGTKAGSTKKSGSGSAAKSSSTPPASTSAPSSTPAPTPSFDPSTNTSTPPASNPPPIIPVIPVDGGAPKN